MLLNLKVYFFLLLSFHCTLAFAIDYNEQSLGKLFTTPAERRVIDADKSGDMQQSTTRNITPSNIKVNGLVIRSKGKNAVWVNGNQSKENQTIDGVKVLSKSVTNKNISIPVLVDGKSIRVKPGQSWSEETGSVVDSY